MIRPTVCEKWNLDIRRSRTCTHVVFISSRCIALLQLIAIWRSSNPRLCPSSSTSSIIPFSSAFSQHSSVTLLRLRGLRNSSAILATLKIVDWHRHPGWTVCDATLLQFSRRPTARSTRDCAASCRTSAGHCSGNECRTMEKRSTSRRRCAPPSTTPPCHVSACDHIVHSLVHITWTELKWTPVSEVTLKMHDLKMTDKKLWVWKMQEWKMTDKLLANCEHNYVCIFDMYLANYRKTLLELD